MFNWSVDFGEEVGWSERVPVPMNERLSVIHSLVPLQDTDKSERMQSKKSREGSHLHRESRWILVKVARPCRGVASPQAGSREPRWRARGDEMGSSARIAGSKLVFILVGRCGRARTRSPIKRPARNSHSRCLVPKPLASTGI